MKLKGTTISANISRQRILTLGVLLDVFGMDMFFAWTVSLTIGCLFCSIKIIILGPYLYSDDVVIA